VISYFTLLLALTEVLPLHSPLLLEVCISSTSLQLHSRFHRMLLDAVWYLLRLESLHLSSLSLCIDRIQLVLNPFSICPDLLLPSYPFITHPVRPTVSIYCKWRCLSFSPNVHFFLYKIPLIRYLKFHILCNCALKNSRLLCIKKKPSRKVPTLGIPHEPWHHDMLKRFIQ
jgi:hypothetical protein